MAHALGVNRPRIQAGQHSPEKAFIVVVFHINNSFLFCERWRSLNKAFAANGSPGVAADNEALTCIEYPAAAAVGFEFFRFGCQISESRVNLLGSIVSAEQNSRFRDVPDGLRNRPSGVSL